MQTQNHKTNGLLHELTFEIIAANKIGWTLGANIAEASANCKKSTRVNPTKFYIVPAGSVIDGFTLIYPTGAKFLITEL